METKNVILARFLDFDVTHYHGNQMSDFPKHFFFVEKFIENQF